MKEPDPVKSREYLRDCYAWRSENGDQRENKVPTRPERRWKEELDRNMDL
jgi:hypothetical protein